MSRNAQRGDYSALPDFGLMQKKANCERALNGLRHNQTETLPSAELPERRHDALRMLGGTGARQRHCGWSARAAPGPLARGFARRARRAAGVAKPAKGRFASALAPSRRSIPRLGKRKKGSRRPRAFKEQGR